MGFGCVDGGCGVDRVDRFDGSGGGGGGLVLIGKGDLFTTGGLTGA